MEEKLKEWKTEGLRRAQFGEWVVYGVRYKSEDGELAWHTTSYPSENPIHHFWVMSGEFHAMAIHYLYNMTYENRVWIGDIVTEITPDERQVVLQAIAKWESEKGTS